MNIDTLVLCLDHPADAVAWLRSLGLNDAARGHAKLGQLARIGVTLDLLAGMCGQLAECLPGLSDPDMAAGWHYLPRNGCHGRTFVGDERTAHWI